MTGASSGIGLETVRSPVSHGASVVGAVRDLAKAEAAATLIRVAASQAGGSLKLIELDLASLRSVRASADQIYIYRGDLPLTRALECRRLQAHGVAWARHQLSAWMPRSPFAHVKSQRIHARAA